MKKIIFALPFILAACDNSPDPASTSAKALAAVKLELNSPDQAVKSWWKVRDGMEAYGPANCKRDVEEHVSTDAFKAGEKMTTGAARVEFTTRPACTLKTFSREIVEVKVESETRAVVLAKVRATTPIPAGATPDADDLKRRTEGFPYKYLLEKVGGEWKIAQIYSYSSYKSDGNPWEPVFSETPRQLVHAYLFGAQ